MFSSLRKMWILIKNDLKNLLRNWKENKGAEKVNSNGCAVMKRTRSILGGNISGIREKRKEGDFLCSKRRKKSMRFQSPLVNWREPWLYLARERSLWAVHLGRSWQAEVEITVSEENKVNRINSHLGRKKLGAKILFKKITYLNTFLFFI